MLRCGCKGIRSCLICNPKIPEVENGNLQENVLYYCPTVNGVVTELCSASDILSESTFYCKDHTKVDFPFTGINIIDNFVSDDEVQSVVTEINKRPWMASQSGRRKQDYGPKVNFKKKKLNCAAFSGLPHYIGFVIERFRLPNSNLRDFLPVEMCNLEYCQNRGSHIEPHFDDFWLWGERLLTINWTGNCYLTFTRPPQTNGKAGDLEEGDAEMIRRGGNGEHVCVCVPMRSKSLITVEGEARHSWHHAVRAEHLVGDETRIATTFRELSVQIASEVEQQQRQEEDSSKNGAGLQRELAVLRLHATKPTSQYCGISVGELVTQH